MPDYRVLIGMNWVPPGKRKERRVEPSALVHGSDFADADSLVLRGRLEPVEETDG